MHKLKRSKIINKLASKRSSGLSIIVFAAVGTTLLLATHAAPPVNNAIEPETATVTSPAIIAADTNVSNGSYVNFVAAASGATLFSENFTTDARSRFDWQLQTTQEPPQKNFLGEHDASCGPSTTYRTVHSVPLAGGVTHTKVDITNSELIWWCADNNPAKNHIMTGLDTDSITALAFSPKQTFTDIKKVCWDQNMNTVSTGKWVNMMVVPNSDVTAKGNDLNYVAGASMAFHSSSQFLPVGAVDFTWLHGSVSSDKIASDGSYHEDFNQWMSIDPQDTNGNGDIDPGDTPTQGIATDPDKLFTICVDDAANKVTIERPNGTEDTYPYSIAFPAGQVRVIFQDASKTPTKYGSAKHLTWHWDNIIIE